MANQLDELSTEHIREEGLDTHVIAKKIPAKVGFGSTIFEIVLWILGIIPGVIFLIKKICTFAMKSIGRNISKRERILSLSTIPHH